MRRLAIAVLTIAATLAGSMHPGSAQFNNRYCAQGGRGSGEPDCSYSTMDQCRASASGLGRYCVENPNWRPQTRSQRRKDSRRNND